MFLKEACENGIGIASRLGGRGKSGKREVKSRQAGSNDVEARNWTVFMSSPAQSSRVESSRSRGRGQGQGQGQGPGPPPAKNGANPKVGKVIKCKCKFPVALILITS